LKPYGGPSRWSTERTGEWEPLVAVGLGVNVPWVSRLSPIQ